MALFSHTQVSQEVIFAQLHEMGSTSSLYRVSNDTDKNCEVTVPLYYFQTHKL